MSDFGRWSYSLRYSGGMCVAVAEGTITVPIMGNGRQGQAPGPGQQGGVLQTDGVYNESSSTVNRQSYFQLGRPQSGTVPESEITVRVTCKHLSIGNFHSSQVEQRKKRTEMYKRTDGKLKPVLTWLRSRLFVQIVWLMKINCAIFVYKNNILIDFLVDIICAVGYKFIHSIYLFLDSILVAIDHRPLLSSCRRALN